ncbi:diguanylate cyclase (GGDEF domain) with PAS/PAC sensor [Desulfovibrio sp. DV]|uniref:diguanylate cyclase n=1 Tax=Desulfovibrio sp. DV TaxID=1844708 RepID=UPI00094BC21A|nr:diguanylate cyclase [Desulfovibrio sp. DV]OLN30582.1 diguanylate cyclase (GGDEF domain) with PAS/PAC sensor [Desulfovibrio sp. DV]
MEMQTIPATVLIVDDAPSNLAILTETLRAEFDVRIASSGIQALQLVDESPPDLILLDIVMPDMDGYEVCRRLKARAATRNIPIIFLTAKGDVSDETMGLALGAVDYIVKPVSVPIVQARVRTHVELKRRGDLLETLSMRDGLTGIANRRRFDDCLGRAWRQSMRGATPLALIMADIDCFKAYNDTYGHMAGDECLKAVARTLTGALKRPGDLAARFGGEEFVMVLEDTDIGGALHLAETMRAAVEALGLEHAGSSVAQSPTRVLTITLGAAAIVPTPAFTPEALLCLADRKLYEAKQAGRNRVLGIQLS